MEFVATKNDEKMIFALPSDLKKELTRVAKDKDVKLSAFVREAVIEKIRRVTKEQIKQELREGYRANYKALKKESDDWDYVSVEGL